MILKDVVRWLLDNNYAVLVNEELTLTGKIHKELQQAGGVPAKKIKKAEVEAQYRALWKDFVDKAEIPNTASAQDGKHYYLRPYSLGGVIELIRILDRKDIDREKFVASTRYYYKTAAFKKTLLNYFRDGLWEEVYNTYLASPKIHVGENPFDT
jgi:hypothetical protein